MKPTLGDKQAFFAQSIGHNIIIIRDIDYLEDIEINKGDIMRLVMVNLSTRLNIEAGGHTESWNVAFENEDGEYICTWIQETDYSLQLKDLKSICDEDAKVLDPIIEVFYSDIYSLSVWLQKKALKGNLNYEAVDYLRSKGYALPFRNYSVEQMIEEGWIKLI